MYIEGNGKNSIIHVCNKEIIDSNETLSSLENRLKGQKKFFRCHKSYIVNLKYVKSFDHKRIYLTVNNNSVLLSRYKYDDLVDSYIDYSGRMRW